MTNDTESQSNVNIKNKVYYLDPHFISKVKNKGDLLQCFTCNHNPLAPEDLAVNTDTFYRWKSITTKKIKFTNGVPIASELLKVFKLKSWITVLLLLKIALHKQLSIGKARLIYKDLTKRSVFSTDILKLLSIQKVLHIQLNGYILQIVYNKDGGLFLEDNSKWIPNTTQAQIDNLAKARAAKENKRVFLPLSPNYLQEQEETIQIVKDYFADIEWNKRINDFK